MINDTLTTPAPDKLRMCNRFVSGKPPSVMFSTCACNTDGGTRCAVGVVDDVCEGTKVGLGVGVGRTVVDGDRDGVGGDPYDAVAVGIRMRKRGSYSSSSFAAMLVRKVIQKKRKRRCNSVMNLIK